MNNKVFLQSLGCPKNLVDSEVMSGTLREAGFEFAKEPEDADILLVNTCGFIAPAVEEGIDAILNLGEIKKRKPGCKLIVTGCMVQRYGDKLREELPEVDLFLGVDDAAVIAKKISNLQSCTPEIRLARPKYLMNSLTPRALSTPQFRSYLKITEGCSNRCSYCLIPSLRGPLRSRDLKDLVKEAKVLEQSGTQELTLIAQDLTAYGMDLGADRERLVDLLQALLAETDIPWLRMLYLYPMRIDEKLLDLVAENERILPYFDIPLQHISDNILKSMNRPYSRKQVESLLAQIRNKVPNGAIRTTFITGFPGEKEAELEELAGFLTEQKLNHVGIFTYSNEEGSKAATFSDQCPEDVKEQRRERLMSLQAEISLAANRELVGSIQPVLVEGVSRESDLLLEARTRFQAPEIDGRVYITSGECVPGAIVDVRITDAHPYDLVGEIFSQEA